MKHHTTASYSAARGHRTRFLPAFTLIEMVVSLSVISIVFLAMGSVMVLAAKAIPNPDNPVNLTIEASDVLQQICSELEVATLMKTATATEVEFDVPDRDSDSDDETIKYKWSGVAGDPLLRQYNGGKTVEVLPAVFEFDLGYIVDVPPDQTQPEIEGAEVLFLMQDSTNSGDGNGISLSNDNSVAQVFSPTLPADASSWRITRVMTLNSPKKPAAETLSVSVRPTAADGSPTATKIDEVLRAESDLQNNTWQTFTFTNAGGLDPSSFYAIACTNATGVGNTGTVKTGTDSFGSPNSKYYFHPGGTNPWINDLSVDMWLFVYGTVSKLDPSWTPSGGPLASVAITLNPGADPSSQLLTEVATLNRPEMP